MYGKKAAALVKLLKDKHIIGAKGTIQIELLGTSVNVSDKSAVGNLLQEWLAQWMTDNKIIYRVNINSQIPPDFYLNQKNNKDLLEVKTFSHNASPNFDVANFDAYTRSLRTDAFRLDADYLIMGYLLEKGVITIKDLWLKKIWEITCPSTQYTLRTQVKQGIIVNIRPYNFQRLSRGHQPFASRLEFVIAIKQTLEKYKSKKFAKDWLTDVEKSYLESTGSNL